MPPGSAKKLTLPVVVSSSFWTILRVTASRLWATDRPAGDSSCQTSDLTCCCSERETLLAGKSHGLVKYTPLVRRQSAIKINNVGNLIARQDFILGIVSVKHPNMISKQV